MRALSQSLKVLADPTRLRLLRLLSRQALSVGEITSILGMAQPTVSKQLAALRQAGLVLEERDGAYAFYRLEAAGEPLWPAVAARLEAEGDPHGDGARLAEVVRRRLDRGLAAGRCLEPGRSWPAWARALGHLIPPLRVADLGCGDGALTVEIARWARSVIAVDRDPARLAAARRRLGRTAVGRVRFLREELSRLSLPDGCVDLVVISQALHHDDEPAAALAEAARILAADGRLLVLDLAPHSETWVRDKLGHRRLGYAAADLAAIAAAAGFTSIESEVLAKGPRDPFHILLLSARRPARPATARPRRVAARRRGRAAAGSDRAGSTRTKR